MAWGSDSRAPWLIVLAAGEGTRLAPLTRALYGRPLPKQFAVLSGRRSLLQRTITRFAPLVPAARTVVIVPAADAQLAARQLAQWPDLHIIAQPENRGTGAGVLLPLLHVLARDPLARVIITPADHHIPRARPLLAAVRRALAALPIAPVTLLGVRADSPETEYGWIVPGAPLAADVHEIRCFVEKPPRELARELHEAGGLWNSFVTVADGETLRQLAAWHLPEQLAALEVAIRDVPDTLARHYAVLSPANFSTDLLARAARLAVITVKGSGWADWGSPDRVLASLPRTQLAVLRRRLQAGAPPVPAA